MKNRRVTIDAPATDTEQHCKLISEATPIAQSYLLWLDTSRDYKDKPVPYKNWRVHETKTGNIIVKYSK